MKLNDKVTYGNLYKKKNLFIAFNASRKISLIPKKKDYVILQVPLFSFSLCWRNRVDSLNNGPHAIASSRAHTRQYQPQEHASPSYNSCKTLVDAAYGSALIRKKPRKSSSAWRSAAAARGRQHPLSRWTVAAVIPEISFHPRSSSLRLLRRPTHKTDKCVRSIEHCVSNISVKKLARSTD